MVLDELDSFLPKRNSSRSLKALITNPSTLERRARSCSRVADDGRNVLSSYNLLLYHLLDMITGKGLLISLVGLCARLTTMSSYEKRVQS